MATGEDPRAVGAGAGRTAEPGPAGGAGAATGGSVGARPGGDGGGAATDDLRQALMSTEFLVFVGLVAGLILASVVDHGFGTDRLWFFLTLLVVGYLVSRGLAKSLRGQGAEGAPSFLTTELWVFLVALVALFITGIATVGEGYGEFACAAVLPAERCDVLDSDRVWLYGTLMGIGYLVSRGLAKSGGRSRASGEALMGPGSRGS
jgi:hypothetical protein